MDGIEESFLKNTRLRQNYKKFYCLKVRKNQAKASKLWAELQKKVKENGKKKFFFDSLNKSERAYAIVLKRRGYIYVTRRFEIEINEEKRGKRFE